jgi:hypothetical protein
MPTLTWSSSSLVMRNQCMQPMLSTVSATAVLARSGLMLMHLCPRSGPTAMRSSPLATHHGAMFLFLQMPGLASHRPSFNTICATIKPATRCAKHGGPTSGIKSTLARCSTCTCNLPLVPSPSLATTLHLAANGGELKIGRVVQGTRPSSGGDTRMCVEALRPKSSETVKVRGTCHPTTKIFLLSLSIHFYNVKIYLLMFFNHFLLGQY